MIETLEREVEVIVASVAKGAEQDEFDLASLVNRLKAHHKEIVDSLEVRVKGGKVI
jgi:hypothetical protein